MVYKDIKIKMPKWVNYILDTLHEFGHEGYVVGGCVRDSLLQREIHDWDITTNALPQDIMDVFTGLGYRVVETGVKHGTVTVIVDNTGYEITTYRVDGVYEDNRHPSEVTFTNSLKEDLSRRDFTINAMAYGDEKGLIDYFGGLEDLKNKVIRCVGSADNRFNEDALRMLRACRFASQLEFEVDDLIIQSIIKNCNLINNISMERISSELNKILLSKSLNGLYHIFQNGIGEQIIPELIKCFECYQNNPYHIYNVGLHILKSVSSIVEDNLSLKLTMLLHDICKPQTKTTDKNNIDHFYNHAELSSEKAREILRRMKYDNKTIDKVAILIKYHDREISGKKSIRKLLNLIGEDNFRDLLKVKEADIEAQNPKYYQSRHDKLIKVEKNLNEIFNAKECFSVKDLDIDGYDLINLGYKGKEIGNTLNKLLDIVLDNPELNNKEKLIKSIEKSV